MPDCPTPTVWPLIAGWLLGAVVVCGTIVQRTLRGPSRHKEYGDGHDD